MDDDVPMTERPKSHKRKADSQRPEPVQPAQSIPDINMAGLLLGLAEGMFTAAWGEEARFTPKERGMIQPPLGRILAKLSPEDGARFTAFADPVFLAAGFLIWGMRIWTLQQKAVRPTPLRRVDNDRGPVVQGMPADQVVSRHSPTPEEIQKNGSANVRDDIVQEWGSI